MASLELAPDDPFVPERDIPALRDAVVRALSKPTQPED